MAVVVTCDVASLAEAFGLGPGRSLTCFDPFKHLHGAMKQGCCMLRPALISPRNTPQEKRAHTHTRMKDASSRGLLASSINRGRLATATLLFEPAA